MTVLVVGGGPAGSAAALALARAGVPVRVADRARFPRPKLCGGLLTWKSRRLLETVFRLTDQDLEDAGAVQGRSDRYALFHKGRPVVEGTLPEPFVFVDRRMLDALLLDRAVQAGAEFLPGVRVTACRPMAGELETTDGVLRGNHIIGCDGANSVVRAAVMTEAGMPRTAWTRNLGTALEAHIPWEALPWRVDHPQLYSGPVTAGYGWVFPNRDHAVVGICGLRRKNGNFRTLYDAWLRSLGVADPDAHPPRAHPLPYGNRLPAFSAGRVILAGDAGGFVEPLFGEGIFYALATGAHAGLAVADGMAGGTDPETGYAERLGRTILPELDAADRYRWGLFTAQRLLGAAGLRLFAKPGNRKPAEMVHGMRSWIRMRPKDWELFPSA